MTQPRSELGLEHRPAGQPGQPSDRDIATLRATLKIFFMRGIKSLEWSSRVTFHIEREVFRTGRRNRQDKSISKTLPMCGLFDP